MRYPSSLHALSRVPALMAAAVAALLLCASCAKMGQPDGGWYDETPPRIMHTSPAEHATDVKSKKVAIFFDEFIQLDNPTEKVVVSPPQLEQPDIKGQGKSVVVQLKDSLHKNTTYTIDFSDAISDNNEGNPLGNYAFTFSTGDHIDTLEVAGYVLEASNLEPIKGILVGLYSNLADTAFTKLPFQRMGRTDSRGHFVIRGVAPGNYRVYALQDMDANYRFSQRAEELAYSKDIIKPSFKPDVRQDTIWLDSLHIDNIVQTPYTHFLPDDVVLRAFTEEQTDRYFIKADRNEANHFDIIFSYGSDKLPELKGLNFSADSAFIIEPSERGDSITYWLRDTALINQDTLRLRMAYEGTDSLGQLRPMADTLEILSKQPYAKRLKETQRKQDEWAKQQEKRRKKGLEVLPEMPAEPLQPQYNVPSTIKPDEQLGVVMPTPLAIADTAKIHLYTKIDTLWYRSRVALYPVAGKLRQYELAGKWRPGGEYSLEVDSGAFVDIYGKATAPFKQGFKVYPLEELGSLQIDIQGQDALQYIVQLLNSQEGVVQQVVTKSNTALFKYVKPGTYFLRMIVDANMNGKWDTGEYGSDLQPEQVYYYPKSIACRAKWDIKQAWNPTALPLNRQKPGEITKQKPDEKKKTINRNAQRARQMGITYTPDKKIKQ